MKKENKATKVIRLVLDTEVGKVFDWEDRRVFGAMLFRTNLKEHFSKHISSFMGRTMFDSSNGMKQIEKILNKKLTYYMRRFDSQDEREGAEKMFEHIKKEFKKINE